MKCQALFCGKNHRYLGSVGQCRPKKNILYMYIFFSQVIARLQILSRKRGITVPKIFWGLPPLLVWVPLSIMNNQSEFQVNIFSNDRDITKCPSFCTTTQTMPELWQYLIVFFENSRAKKIYTRYFFGPALPYWPQVSVGKISPNIWWLSQQSTKA